METFEYMILDVVLGPAPVEGPSLMVEPTLDELNKAAADGWRLVGTFARAETFTAGYPAFFRGFVLERSTST